MKHVLAGRWLLALALTLAPAVNAGAEPGPFSITLMPEAGVLVGYDGFPSPFEVGAVLRADFRLPFLPFLSVGVEAGYALIPIAQLSGGARLGVAWDVLPSLTLSASGSVGVSLGTAVNLYVGPVPFPADSGIGAQAARLVGWRGRQRPFPDA